MGKLRRWLTGIPTLVGNRLPPINLLEGAIRILVIAMVIIVVLVLLVSYRGQGGPKITASTWGCSSANDTNGLIEVRGTGFTPGGKALVVATSATTLRRGLARKANMQGRTIWLFKCSGFSGEVTFAAADVNAEKTAVTTIAVKK